MERNNKKGFTLIELLVVIAIIGILSAVVLASLNTARQRGADAAIGQNLSQIRAQAELVYDDSLSGGVNSYDAVCDDAVVTNMVEEAQNRAPAGEGDCHDNATAWAAWADLHGGGFFCADSTGKSGVVPTGTKPTDTAPLCP